MEIRPRQKVRRPQNWSLRSGPVNLITEKAMMMEGRKLGSLNDPILLSYLEQQKRQKLGRMVVMDHIRKNLSVSDAEIDERMKTDPNLPRERASMLVQQTKGRALLEQFYKQLWFHSSRCRRLRARRF
jgi:hypothetical protein